MCNSPTRNRRLKIYPLFSILNGFLDAKSFQQLERWNMIKSEMLNRFPAHRLEGALRFSAYAQVLYNLHGWEKAQARNELVRVCYSERIVGLLRNKEISTSVHRRAGPQAVRDFARVLDAEGKIG